LGGIFFLSFFIAGIRIWGNGNRVRGNLVTLSVWPGTYQNRKDLSSTLWHAAIEVARKNYNYSKLQLQFIIISVGIVNLFFWFLFFLNFFVVLCVGTLWHLQKFLQCIKYIILNSPPLTLSFIPPLLMTVLKTIFSLRIWWINKVNELLKMWCKLW
jgi:hypothetical protein